VFTASAVNREAFSLKQRFKAIQSMNQRSGEFDVEVRGVSKQYGAFTALNRVDLAVAKGELTSLLGPSGCGKTTLLRSIAGLVDPSEGSIRIGGKEVLGVAPHQRNVGFVFQNYALFPHMTVRQNVAFGLRMRGAPRRSIDDEVEEVLSTVQLQELSHRYPAELSGGQQQRVALARSIVLKPTVLLLDEPFAALDRALRDRMQMELRSLQRRVGITTIFVTHDQDEALRISDRIAVMRSGRIEQIDNPVSLYNSPKTPFVLGFIGQSNTFPGKVIEKRQSSLVINIRGETIVAEEKIDRQRQLGEAVLVSIRPERISVSAEAASDGYNSLRARVIDLIFLGDSIELHLASSISDQPTIVYLQNDALAGPLTNVERGQEMWLSWRFEETLIFTAQAEVDCP
jgi:putative spermidine/putrescine transport system ATP-binding protein